MKEPIMKKTGLFDGGGSEFDNEDFEHDPESEDNSKKYRLPFALCKQHGIDIQDWWTPRDAWTALQQGGKVDDVSEEYKEFYKNLKSEQSKKSRNRKKLKQTQLADPEHNPDKNYKHSDGAIAGAEKGRPMSFEQADSGRVNPFLDKGIGYRHNCQTCVAAYYARRLGYDVRALPNLNNRNIAELSYDVSLAYIAGNGQKPVKTTKPKGEQTKEFLNKQVKSNGIYAVSFDWKGKASGHIITVERKNDGQLSLYDPQINQTYAGDNITQYFKRTQNIEIIQLSGCRINESFADKIMKRSKK